MHGSSRAGRARQCRFGDGEDFAVANNAHCAAKNRQATATQPFTRAIGDSNLRSFRRAERIHKNVLTIRVPIVSMYNQRIRTVGNRTAQYARDL